MRATRAYLAGAGTAGSLVAGAAVLFVLASAIVAFNGWPQRSLPAQATAVVPAPVASPDQSVAATRVLLAAAATSPPSVRLAAALRAPVQLGSVTIPGLPGVPGPVPHRGSFPKVTPPAGHAPTAAGSTGLNAPVSTGALSAPTAPVASALSHVTTTATSTLGTALTGTGQTAASVVSGSAGAVSSAVKPVSPSLAHTVDQAGSALAGVTDRTVGALGSTVTDAGAKAGAALESPAVR